MESRIRGRVQRERMRRERQRSWRVERERQRGGQRVVGQWEAA